MFENICTLPVSDDVFCLALHPTQPLFAVGLSSGHVQTFKLPSIAAASSSEPDSGRTADTPLQRLIAESSGKPSAIRRRSSTSSNASSAASDGYSTVDTVWRTRRHKGSCRALAYSQDGALLFSAGSDGLIKIADSATGKVRCKCVVPRFQDDEDGPTALLVLSALQFVVGTDSGAVHVYSATDSADTKKRPRQERLFETHPTKTTRPHRNEEDPDTTEAITSLSALPPTAQSTSGASRTWVSTAGSSLAVSDLHKAKIETSIDQGHALLSSVCLKASSATKPDTLVLGTDLGVATVWKRGAWDDQQSRIVVQRPGTSPAPAVFAHDMSVECLAVMPDSTVSTLGIGLGPSSAVLAAGLADGQVVFFRVGRNAGKGPGSGIRMGSLPHDEQGLEGVVAIGFDGHGRMVTAGGAAVRVWRVENASAPALDSSSDDGGDDEDGVVQSEDGDAAEEESDEEEDEEEDEDEDGSEDSSEDDRPRKQQKKKNKVGVHGHHGVMAFKDLD